MMPNRSVAVDVLDQARRDVGEDSAALVGRWPAVVDAYSGPSRWCGSATGSCAPS